MLRRYISKFGTRGIEEEDPSGAGDAGFVRLGMGFEAALSRRGRLNFAVSNPLCKRTPSSGGPPQSNSKQEFYTVGAVVHYLKSCHSGEGGSDGADSGFGDSSGGIAAASSAEGGGGFDAAYAAYMETCLEKDEDVVLFRDGKAIADYFFGRSRHLGRRNKVGVCFIREEFSFT